MGTEELWIGRNHDTEVRTWFHGAHKFPNKWDIVFHMLEDIEEKESVCPTNLVRNTLGSRSMDKPALRKTGTGQCDSIGIRINTDTCIFFVECSSIAPSPTPNIDNVPFTTGGKKPMEKGLHNLPSPSKPPVDLLELCVDLELR